MSMMRLVGLVLGLAAISSSISVGDHIEFVRGGSVDLPVIQQVGDLVRLDGPTGPIELARSDLKSIEPGFAPPTGWRQRWASVELADTAEQFAAAWYALENGLISECVSALRSIHERDPDHTLTARLVRVLDELDRPCPDPDLAAITPLVRALPRVDRSAHVVMLHDLDPEGARTRLEMLENVLTGFYLNLTAYGSELAAPTEKAVVIWMPDRASYRVALKRLGAGDFGATRGYFHPTLRVMLTYDGRSEPGYRSERSLIERQRSQPARRLTPGRAIPDEVRDLDRRQLLLDIERIDLEFAAAAHEMAHLLVRASGLAPSHDAFPIWLHEGLAMQFEVVRSGRWAGIGRVNPHRLAYWPGASRPIRLDRVLRDEGLGAGYRAEAYAGSWALVYFLRKQHPDEFQALLDRLRQPGQGGSGAFLASLGVQCQDLESRWHTFIGTLAVARPTATAQEEPQPAGGRVVVEDLDAVEVAPAGVEPATSRL